MNTGRGDGDGNEWPRRPAGTGGSPWTRRTGGFGEETRARGPTMMKLSPRRGRRLARRAARSAAATSWEVRKPSPVILVSSMALSVSRRRAEPTSGLGVDALRPLPRNFSAGGRTTSSLKLGRLDARLELLLLGTHQNGFPSAYTRSRARGGGDAGRRLAPTRWTGRGPVRGRARPRVSGGGHRDDTNTPILYNNKHHVRRRAESSSPTT